MSHNYEQVEENDRIGMNGWDEIKNHLFFSSLDWDRLQEIEPPPEPIILEPASIDASAKANYRISKTFGQRFCCCCVNSEKYVPNTKAW